MNDPLILLADYLENGSEPAFRELVARFVDLVYSTAVRLVDGDAHMAEDVAQTVFADLARLGRTLSKEVMLGGWLHRHTCFVAATVMRGERRRQSRERQAVEMNALQDQSEANLTQVGPILDEAVNQLGAEDRTAILLRFFEQHDFRSVGEALGSNEDAARMRVTRALEKLHVLLRQRGVTLPAAVLGTALATGAVSAAPVGLAASISGSVLAGAAAGTGTTLTFLKLMAMTKLKAGVIGAVVVASAATSLVIQHRSQVKLRDENQSLRRQITQLRTDNDNLSSRLAHANSSLVLKLPAPPVRSSTPPTGPPMDDLTATNLYARLKDNSAKLTASQVEPYLNANRRSASSLLAAYRTTGDPALLEEAIQKYPEDAQVAFEAVFKKDASPVDRRQWLEAFKKSASDNALPNYLSALDYFKAGQTDQAVQELIAAAGKQQFQDFTLDRMQDDEEAYLAAGYPMAEAKTIPAWQLLLPQLAQIKELSQHMVDLANSYRQAGDQASAQAALQMAANLGQRYGNTVGGETEISRLVGMAVERIALSAMDPNSPYGSGEQAVKDRLDDLAQQSAQLRKLAQQVEALQPMMSDQDWISYKDRWRVFGEEAAARWLVSKYGQK